VSVSPEQRRQEMEPAVQATATAQVMQPLLNQRRQQMLSLLPAALLPVQLMHALLPPPLRIPILVLLLCTQQRKGPRGLKYCRLHHDHSSKKEVFQNKSGGGVLMRSSECKLSASGPAQRCFRNLGPIITSGLRMEEHRHLDRQRVMLLLPPRQQLPPPLLLLLRLQLRPWQ